MTERRLRNAGARAAYATVAVIGMLTAYSVAYVLLVNPIWVIPHFGAGWHRDADYKCPPWARGTTEAIFGPANKIDRRLRREFWKKTKPYLGGNAP